MRTILKPTCLEVLFFKFFFILSLLLSYSCKNVDMGYLDQLTDEQRANIESQFKSTCLANSLEVKERMIKETALNLQRMELFTSYTYTLTREEGNTSESFTEEIDLIAKKIEDGEPVYYFYVKQLSNTLNRYERFSSGSNPPVITPFTVRETTNYILRYPISHNQALSEQIIDAFCSNARNIRFDNQERFSYTYTQEGATSFNVIYSIQRRYRVSYFTPVFFEKYYYERIGTVDTTQAIQQGGQAPPSSSDENTQDTVQLVFIQRNYSPAQLTEVIQATQGNRHCEIVPSSLTSIAFSDYSSVIKESVSGPSYQLDCNNVFSTADIL